MNVMRQAVGLGQGHEHKSDLFTSSQAIGETWTSSTFRGASLTANSSTDTRCPDSPVAYSSPWGVHLILEGKHKNFVCASHLATS